MLGVKPATLGRQTPPRLLNLFIYLLHKEFARITNTRMSSGALFSYKKVFIWIVWD